MSMGYELKKWFEDLFGVRTRRQREGSEMPLALGADMESSEEGSQVG